MCDIPILMRTTRTRYHFARTDHRHNFSPYFYLLYLQPEHKTVVGLCALLPQLILLVVFTIRFHEDITFCVTAITVVFVVFNKVCTVQYFVWYFCLLPFVLPSSSMPARTGAWLFLAWGGGQACWLGCAYRPRHTSPERRTAIDTWTAWIDCKFPCVSPP